MDDELLDRLFEAGRRAGNGEGDPSARALVNRYSKKWRASVARPDKGDVNMMGQKSFDGFIDRGEILANSVFAAMAGRFGKSVYGIRTLEFGCGGGRVLLPLQYGHGLDLLACDVNPTAVRYLRRAAKPDTSIRITNYDPPLPYKDATFDCVFAISIWTHLPLAMQIPWLAEIKRILKPGGLALISASGHRALKSRHMRKSKDWLDVSSDDLTEQGIVYREYQRFADKPDQFENVGITASYGLTAHDPAYIRREWSKVMEVADVVEQGVSVQDLVFMKA